MTKGTILIYDDDSGMAERYRNLLWEIDVVSENFQSSYLDDDKFTGEMIELKARQSSSQEQQVPKLGGLVIDNANIFIVDYYLVKSSKGGFTNGELVSYISRCFSRCGLIVGLNRFGTNSFDLTLKGHPESFADLNLGSGQLSNRGLWGGTTTGFHPWHWPNLMKYLRSFDRKSAFVSENSSASVLKTLELQRFVDSIPTSALEFLGENPSEINFEQFVRTSPYGLQGGDRAGAFSNEAIGRIAASRLSKWVERMLLPGQEFFVDAPHLVSRFGSLLNGDATKETLDLTTSLEDAESLGIKNSLIESFRYKLDDWISRPVWFWSEVSNDKGIKEVIEPWTGNKGPLVFCEDASRFFPREETTEFVSQVDSAYRRRYIKRFDNVTYTPTTRRLLAKTKAGKVD